MQEIQSLEALLNQEKKVLIISQRFLSLSHFQAKFWKGCDLMLLNEVD